MTIETMALAQMAEVDPHSAAKKLGEMHGYRVSFDRDGDFRFWKWGNEFFCVPQHRVVAALHALTARKGPDHGRD